MAVTQQFAALASVGFTVVAHRSAKALSVESLTAELAKQRDDPNFEIDGLVIVDDNVHARLEGKNPDYAFVFKVNAAAQDSAEVCVTKVVWEVSKDNFLIPTVHYTPTELDGVTMTKATGFNAKFIVANGIGPGAVMVVVRSGQVIPYILSVIKEVDPQLPEGDYAWNESRIHIMATSDSRERLVQANTYFLRTIGVKGVSDKTVEHMYDHGFTTIKDIINVEEADLMRMDGFQQRSASNVVSAIASALEHATCLQIMSASNIFGRGFAEKKLALIVDALPDISEAKLLAVDGIGPVLARQFMANYEAFEAFIKDTGIKCETKQPAATSNALAGTVAVFTNFRDADLVAFVASNGGRIVGTVSGVVTVLVNGDPAKSTGKVAEALERGVPIVTVEAFKKIISFYK
jgi:NAD-dependent DNA ligase